MMRAVGSLQIMERRNKFQVREGRKIISVRDNYVHAGDAALRYWLDANRKPHDDDEVRV